MRRGLVTAWSHARSMARGAIAIAVALLFGALPVLGHARPPDPVWIEGFYDDGDQDDLIALATSATAVAADPPAWRPCLAAGERAVMPHDAPRGAPAPPPVRPRGPPPL